MFLLISYWGFEQSGSHKTCVSWRQARLPPLRKYRTCLIVLAIRLQRFAHVLLAGIWVSLINQDLLDLPASSGVLGVA